MVVLIPDGIVQLGGAGAAGCQVDGDGDDGGDAAGQSTLAGGAVGRRSLHVEH